MQLLQRVRLWVRQLIGGGFLRGVRDGANDIRRPGFRQALARGAAAAGRDAVGALEEAREVRQVGEAVARGRLLDGERRIAQRLPRQREASVEVEAVRRLARLPQERPVKVALAQPRRRRELAHGDVAVRVRGEVA